MMMRRMKETKHCAPQADSNARQYDGFKGSPGKSQKVFDVCPTACNPPVLFNLSLFCPGVGTELPVN